MRDQDAANPPRAATIARRPGRETLPRAEKELNTMSEPGLEQALAQISAEVTEQAVYRHAAADGNAADAALAAAGIAPGRA